ncbi:MAG: hypothetical protein KVP17_003110 [Porospora cf. gigantea B]|uniref:uncharacterized protein n=1 Tax=Porospora cf. gigantea B TaxID=2853592 RepID=UPI003571E79A|nr:MAG: hypothetical protein KVP17_003110 [Porospora cf. gigantea B]
MSHLSVTQLRDQAFLPLCLVSSTSVHMTTSGQTTSVKPETTMESSFSVSPNASRPVSQDSFRYSVLRPEPRPSRANLTDAAIGPDRSRPDGNPLLFEEAPLQSPPCFTTRDMNPCRLSKPRPTRHQATSLQAVRRNVSARMHGEPALDDSWVERVREESDWCRSQLDELPTLFEASVKTIRRLESYNVDAYKEHRAEKARLKSDTEMGLFQDHNTILRSSDLGSLFPTPRLHLGTPCSHLPLQSESRIVTLFSELHSNVSITLTKFLEQSDAKKTKWLAKLTPKLYKTSPSNYRAILVILAAENCRRMEQRLLAVKTLWSLASDVVQTDRNGCWSVVEKVHKVLPGFAIDATLKLSNDCAPFRGLGALQTPLLPAQEPSTLVWDMTIPWKQTGIAAVDSSLTAKDLQMHMTNTSACYSQAALYSHFNGRTLYPVGVTDEQFCSRGPAFNLMASPHRKDNAFERLQQAVFLGVTVVVRHLRYLGLGQVNDAVEAILAKQDDLLLLTARSRLDDCG